MNSSLLLTGIGLRPPHYHELIEKKPSVAWLEVHSENFFGEGGSALAHLEQARAHYPISLHGVSLSLGSADELNWAHVKKLKELIEFIDPCLVSEHLSWSSFQGQYFHDLLPLPYTEESLQHVVSRIQSVQDFLNRQILIENISSYMQYHSSTLTEAHFIVEVSKKSGCGILLDINNIYISATNLNKDPNQYIDHIPSECVHEIHLGGFTSMTLQEKEILIDTHNRPIVPAVWDLYRYATHHLGPKPTIIEWDNQLPTLDALCTEAYRAEKILRESHAARKLTG